MSEPTARSPFPEAPKCSVASVENSEYKQEIFDRLLSGWSPSRISRAVHQQHGVLVLPLDIKQFLGEIPAAMLLPPSELRRRLKQIDVDIDAVGQMGMLLRLAADRLDTSLLLEEAVNKRSGKTEQLIGSYWRMLERYVAIRQRLGDLPTAATEYKVGPTDDTSTMPTLRELLDTVDESVDMVSPSSIAQ